MNASDAILRLSQLARFGPGATLEGSSATFSNVLLRAERALAGMSLSDERSLPLELAALRDNLAQRQDMLGRIHDALLSDRKARVRRSAKACDRCGNEFTDRGGPSLECDCGQKVGP